jgi:predicted Zn finger-like uncharacterized protein
MIVPCECGAKLRVDDAKVRDKSVKVRCPRCGNVLLVQKQPAELASSRPANTAALQPSGAPLVLVAHDSEVVRTMISQVLQDAGFAVDTASDGHEALRKAVNARPQAMVLDVGLSGIYGFELCERLKGNAQTSVIKIVLLSAVYDMRRYKRTPVSLYGADDYIEKHHIPDFLPVKIRNLIQPSESSKTRTAGVSSDAPPKKGTPSREFDLALFKPQSLMSAEPQQATAVASASAGESTAIRADMPDSAAISPESLSLDSSIFQKEECDIPAVDAADPEAEEKARRFARIIVSDIALYNQEAVVEGLRNGTFYELLKNDVTEGRELYEKRVPAAVRTKKDYYQEAFDNFIKTQKKTVR